jgi:tetratricopeptide (TPR) repeat protein
MCLVALAAALSLSSGCGRDEQKPRGVGTRAVVIGIDGADWTLIEEIAAEGGMPNLVALRERGSWGPLETLADVPLSPVIWTSIATGKTAAKHGISWFMVDRPDGTRVPVRSHNRKVDAIWNILAQRRRTPVVVGWWATYPAEEVGRGTIVSDGLGYHGFGSTARGADDRAKVYPPARFAELDALVPALQQIPFEFVSRFVQLEESEYRAEMFDPARFPQPDPSNPVHLLQQYVATAQGYTAIGERLLEENDFDLMMVYFEQVDSLSHLFMKYDPPKLEWVEEVAYQRYKEVVREWYRYQDEMLGRLLAHIDLTRTAVFVVSDHGFKSGDRRIRSDETVDVKRAHLDHESDGVYLAAGPHIRQGGAVAGAAVMDITPTLLHYLGFAVAKDMDGRVLTSTFLPSFMDDHPIRYVPTYEDEAVPREGSELEEYDADAAASNERALRALGYLGGARDETAAGGSEASSPEMHNNLGRIHLRNGELDRARAEFRKALDLDRGNADALLNLAALERAEGRTAGAELLIERALQADPNSIAALSQLAEIERDHGNLEEAIRLFEEAMAIDDSQPFLHQGYGDVLQRAGRLAEAERAFRMVLQLDPDSFKAHYNLGVTYGNQGEIDRAVVEYEQALEIDPNHSEAALAHNNLGAIALDRNRVDEAVAHFEKAVRLAPRHLESRYNLALVYLEGGRVEDAIEMLEAATSIDPDHELVNVRLGLAYLEANRGDDAFRTFTLVRRLYPENWVGPLGLAVLYGAGQRPDQARVLLEEALELGGQQARRAAEAYPAIADLL